VVLAGCEPPTEEDGQVTVTLRMRLRAETQDRGPAAGTVWIFAARQNVPRSQAHPSFGLACPFSTTPVTVCEQTVPRGLTLTLIAAEGDPAVFGEFGPPQDSDTAHLAQQVEFGGWAGCDQEPDRGICVVDSSGDVEVGVEYQYLTPVVVYQAGAASFDYLINVTLPTLKVPGQSDNLLNSAGCPGIAHEPPDPCGTVRAVGSQPHRLIRAYVPRAALMYFQPVGGIETNFIEWDFPCGIIQYESGCIFRTAADDTAATPIRLTVKYEYWQCPEGPSDWSEFGRCTLVRP
jgi:hypothetical protein